MGLIKTPLTLCLSAVICLNGCAPAKSDLGPEPHLRVSPGLRQAVFRTLNSGFHRHGARWFGECSGPFAEYAYIEFSNVTLRLRETRFDTPSPSPIKLRPVSESGLEVIVTGFQPHYYRENDQRWYSSDDPVVLKLEARRTHGRWIAHNFDYLCGSGTNCCARPTFPRSRAQQQTNNIAVRGPSSDDYNSIATHWSSTSLAVNSGPPRRNGCTSGNR